MRETKLTPSGLQSSTKRTNTMRHGQRSHIVAHRGGAALHVENSPSAFTNAVSMMGDAVECDVHRSADDEFIVIHDPTLERTLGIAGRVREMNAADLKLHSLLGTAGEAVPLLRELIALVHPTDKTLSLEVKGDEFDIVEEGMARKIADILTIEGMRERTIVHSFDFDFLARFARIAPDIKLGANVEDKTFERLGSFETILDRIVDLDADMLNIDHRLLDETRLQQAWERDLAVTVWTVNDDADLRRWLDLGVDFITTDRPDAALLLRAA